MKGIIEPIFHDILIKLMGFLYKKTRAKEHEKIKQDLARNKKIKLFQFPKITTTDESFMFYPTAIFFAISIVAFVIAILEFNLTFFLVTTAFLALFSVIMYRMYKNCVTRFEIRFDQQKIVRTSKSYSKTSVDVICYIPQVSSIAVDSIEGPKGDLYYLVIVQKDGKRVRVTNNYFVKDIMIEEGQLAASCLKCKFTETGFRKEKKRIYGM